ncbi:MAG TPA: STAS domain-containing protein [Pseudogracilibacillus sp.]|nr:STAS domain-containing protein [Pseudogracilibacillus sp.]
MDLAIDITQEDTYYVVKPAGEIDVYTAPILKEKLIPLTEEQGAKIKVDLHETSYLDSTGLGIFINAYKSAEKHGSELTFIHLHDRILRLFKVTGLYKIMDIKESGE